jgi:hypothetical protein
MVCRTQVARRVMAQKSVLRSSLTHGPVTAATANRATELDSPEQLYVHPHVHEELITSLR